MFVTNPSIAALIKLQRTWLKSTPDDCIAKMYYDSCRADIKSFAKYIPKKVESVLDIGAGMGGVDVLLYKDSPEPKPNMALFDVDRVDDEISYGFSESASGYSRRRDVKAFLKANGVAEKDFVCIKAVPYGHRYDIILSLISCGFHYPVATYLQNIVELLGDRGIVILDIRKGSGQFDLLHNAFKYVNTVQAREKYKRVVCFNG